MCLHEAGFNIVLLSENETKKHRTMRTFIKLPAILTIITLLFSFGAVANVTLDEESYIDDISFDTEAVYSSVVVERNIIDFNFEEEAYIDDIPYAIEEIAEDTLYKLALNQKFSFEEEAYIDDIPFNTEQVCQNLNQLPVTETLSCDADENINKSVREEEITLKYFEQYSHILMRY